MFNEKRMVFTVLNRLNSKFKYTMFCAHLKTKGVIAGLEDRKNGVRPVFESHNVVDRFSLKPIFIPKAMLTVMIVIMPL